ncbi:MAG: hypothetical protein KKE17_02380 [Proteobacteria bacterium]|nr:hypothetical protein [Pseudomonadota bacterium]MBU1708828.1 hypothetical protein [Pseudomonadota bacterium]
MQSLKGFMDNGFILLDVKKNEGLVLGFLFGRKGIKIVSPDAFKQFNAKGYIKCVWNFKLSGRQDATLLSTETRVFCTCKASKFFFSIYWFFIAYFSGLTRVIILKLIKQEAEAAS